MCKRELIDEIIQINASACPAFLAQFQRDDLDDYLRHLKITQTPRPLSFQRLATEIPASAQPPPLPPTARTDLFTHTG